MANAEANFIKKLREAVECSDKALKPFRDQRREFIQSFVGSYYGANESQRRTLNLTLGAVSAMVPFLVPRNPRVNVTSPDPAMRPKGYVLETRLNDWLEDFDYYAVIRRIVLDALFGPGIARCGLAPGNLVEVEGYLHDVGQPYVDPVDLDDYIVDANARTREKAEFEGNKYFLPKSYLLENDYEGADGLYATGDPDYQRGRSSDIGKKQEITGIEPLYPQVPLMDVWLPREGVIWTLSANQDTEKPLKIVEWDGPERGPYEMLTFHEVPAHIMPVADVGNWLPMDLLANDLLHKWATRVKNQKTVLAYEPGAEEDANTIARAEDSEAVKVTNVERVKEFAFGGNNTEMLAIIQQVIGFFSRSAGNVDMLGGLQSGAETLGQEEMLAANQDVRMTDSQETVRRFHVRNLQKVAYYQWTDPLDDTTEQYPVPGTGIEVPIQWSPEMREGNFFATKITIDPYSMEPDTPERMLEKIRTWVGEFVMPLGPAAMAQGSQMNAERIIRMAAEKLGIPEQDEMFVGGQPVPEAQFPAGTPGSESGQRKSPGGRVNVTASRQAATKQPVQASGVK